MAERTYYKNGKRNGVRECWNEDGELLFKNTYEDDKAIYF